MASLLSAFTERREQGIICVFPRGLCCPCSLSAARRVPARRAAAFREGQGLISKPSGAVYKAIPQAGRAWGSRSTHVALGRQLGPPRDPSRIWTITSNVLRSTLDGERIRQLSLRRKDRAPGFAQPTARGSFVHNMAGCISGNMPFARATGRARTGCSLKAFSPGSRGAPR
jgi:hypothetical protein